MKLNYIKNENENNTLEITKDNSKNNNIQPKINKNHFSNILDQKNLSINMDTETGLERIDSIFRNRNPELDEKLSKINLKLRENIKLYDLIIKNDDFDDQIKKSASEETILSLEIHSEPKKYATELISSQNNQNLSASTKNIDKFLNWREENINRMLSICKLLKDDNKKENIEIKQNIKIFLKCMVHLTRKVCKCSFRCLSKHVTNKTFDEKCSLFDLRNLKYDVRYQEGCNKYNKRFLKRDDVRVHLLEEVHEFNKYKNLICSDYKKFNKLKCSAYELRDNCFNDKSCITSNIDDSIGRNCSNPLYDKQISTVSKILRLEFKNNDHQKIKRIQRNLKSTENSLLNYELENAAYIKTCNLVGIIIILALLSIFKTSNLTKKKCLFGYGCFLVVSLFLYLLNFS